MVVLVLYDIPTNTKQRRAMYTRFRKEVLSLGFDMLQYSIYYRHVFGTNARHSLIGKIVKISPKGIKTGISIRILTITEKQFMDMVVVYDTDKKRHKKETKTATGTQLLLF
ncbi:CRISPR-associated endonuclease Cas2 [Hydrogenimonas sp.]